MGTIELPCSTKKRKKQVIVFQNRSSVPFSAGACCFEKLLITACHFRQQHRSVLFSAVCPVLKQERDDFRLASILSTLVTALRTSRYQRTDHFHKH